MTTIASHGATLVRVEHNHHIIQCDCGASFPAVIHPDEPGQWDSPAWEAHVIEARGQTRCTSTYHYGTWGPRYHHGPNPDGGGWVGLCGRPTTNPSGECDECIEYRRVTS